MEKGVVLMSNLSNVLTCDLVNELAKREGVKEYSAPDPDYEYSVMVQNYHEVDDDGTLQISDETTQTGPARILVVID